MKYFILVPDGAADRPMGILEGKTPLEAARMEHINALAREGEVGMVKTIPDGMEPGSDAANLSVMGFDPSVYLTGRSPLEAVSMGIELADTDVAFRANLVTLEGAGAYENFIMKDHGAGDISSEEAKILIELIDEMLGNDKISFYPGVSYRHAMIVHGGSTDYELTPPHDILEREIGKWLPKGKSSECYYITRLMKKSHKILNDHPVNRARVGKGLKPANSIWVWGQGRKPRLVSFREKYGIDGSVISAVDLIKGIGICAGLRVVDVPGATGTLRTNYEGKAEAAIGELKDGRDFVYVHIEAPDECSHQGNARDKIKALEEIDEKVFAPIHAYLKETGEPYRILIVPDHRTPVEIRTHSREPSPFVFFDSRNPGSSSEGKAFTEASGGSGAYFDSGCALAEYFFAK
jgi:2,3-bisphosphoglycerate-independent phosphoglycerate mutase